MNKLYERRKERVLCLRGTEECSTPGEVEDYVGLLTQLFQEQSKPRKFILLQGFLMNHIRMCNIGNCPCEKIANDMQFYDSEDEDTSSQCIMNPRGNSSCI